MQSKSVVSVALRVPNITSVIIRLSGTGKYHVRTRMRRLVCETSLSNPSSWSYKTGKRIHSHPGKSGKARKAKLTFKIALPSGIPEPKPKSNWTGPEVRRW